MEQINTNRSDDKDYRYKMVKIVTSNLGGGNGKKTSLTNIDAVSESIGHPTSILLKFISNKLGSSQNEKEKTINGHYDTEKILDCVFDYVDTFVNCQKCVKPESYPTLEKISKKKSKILFC